MTRRRPDSGVSGLLVLDKPAGPTSHDVVARVRRAVGTRRVGHAGTLDPTATGVLVVGLGAVTKVLGYLSTSTKTYTATVRLGTSTTTDDAQGEPLGGADARAVDEAALAGAVAALTGDLEQVPSTFSAVQVAGVRAYARARAGEEVTLAPRAVRVERFEVLAVRRGTPGSAGPSAGVDVDVETSVSAGTYVRALARDLGASLGVGGHLVALRRTAAGAFTLADAVEVAALASDDWRDGLRSLDEAVAGAMAVLPVDAEQARRLAHGQRLAAVDVPGATDVAPGVPVGLRGPDGVVALAEVSRGAVRPTTVLAPGGRPPAEWITD